MIDQLVAGIKEAPIVVGLDPQMKFIPDEVKNPVFDEMGETLEAAGEILFRFNKAIVDAVCDLVPAVKPQIAMYERFGIPGLAAYQRTIDYCKSRGLVVIGDVKRGDIGSTSETSDRPQRRMLTLTLEGSWSESVSTSCLTRTLRQ